MQEHLRLSELLGYVKDAVALLGEQPIWITAELLQINGTPHRYLELVEYDSNRREVAKAKGMIWKDNTRVLSLFQEATGLALAAGMKILARVKLTYHEVYGLSLAVLDIDPNYTLGDMEARVKLIRDYLKTKGWLGLNRDKEAPQDFTRVAVISPRDAAGLGDFRVEADKLDSLGLCRFTYYHAAFQGQGASDSIVEQMIAAHHDHQAAPYDCLILIRGGGDKAGLYHLNERRLAASVCRFPIPVFVGIGHDRDKVFLDEVACMRFPTPSLLISHIVQTIVRNAQQAEMNLQRLKGQAMLILDKIERRANDHYLTLRDQSINQLRLIEQDVDFKKGRLLNNASSQLDRSESEAVRLKAEVIQQAQASLDRGEHQVDLLISSVMSANPLAILGRGYAYVAKGNAIVTQASQLVAGNRVVVTFKDSSFESIVETIHEQ